jgi:CubicO group peptidase (beta-lactamase class C family)
MQTWLPGKNNPDIPADAFFLQGHDGQTITVIPSLDLVVVRLGLTPKLESLRSDPAGRRGGESNNGALRRR